MNNVLKEVAIPARDQLESRRIENPEPAPIAGNSSTVNQSCSIQADGGNKPFKDGSHSEKRSAKAKPSGGPKSKSTYGPKNKQSKTFVKGSKVNHGKLKAVLESCQDAVDQSQAIGDAHGAQIEELKDRIQEQSDENAALKDLHISSVVEVQARVRDIKKSTNVYDRTAKLSEQDFFSPNLFNVDNGDVDIEIAPCTGRFSCLLDNLWYLTCVEVSSVYENESSKLKGSFDKMATYANQTIEVVKQIVAEVTNDIFDKPCQMFIDDVINSTDKFCSLVADEVQRVESQTNQYVIPRHHVDFDCYAIHLTPPDNTGSSVYVLNGFRRLIKRYGQACTRFPRTCVRHIDAMDSEKYHYYWMDLKMLFPSLIKSAVEYRIQLTEFSFNLFCAFFSQFTHSNISRLWKPADMTLCAVISRKESSFEDDRIQGNRAFCPMQETVTYHAKCYVRMDEQYTWYNMWPQVTFHDVLSVDCPKFVSQNRFGIRLAKPFRISGNALQASNDPSVHYSDADPAAYKMKNINIIKGTSCIVPQLITHLTTGEDPISNSTWLVNCRRQGVVLNSSPLAYTGPNLLK